MQSVLMVSSCFFIRARRRLNNLYRPPQKAQAGQLCNVLRNPFNRPPKAPSRIADKKQRYVCCLFFEEKNCFLSGFRRFYNF